MLVLLAVLISAFRLFLPYVEYYREDFQNYINNNNQTNLVIGNLAMSWQGSGPTLIASRVTLVDSNNAYIYINHLEVEIDFWASLTTQSLISSNLVFDGANVSLDEKAWQSQSNNQANVNKERENTSESLDGFKQISDIFLNRINQFSLVNSKVSLRSKLLEHKISINNLRWFNSGDRHQAQGNIIVDELSSNNLRLNIDLDGHAVDDLKGMMYVEANHIDITPWLDNFLAIDNDNIKADIGFSAWLKVDEGSIERLQVSLHDNIISWQELSEETDINHDLTLSAGQLLVVKGKQSDNLKLYSTPLTIQFDQAKSEEFIVQMQRSPEDFSVYISSFNLALLSQVSPLIIATKEQRALMSELAIEGQVNDIFLKQTSEDFQALASFDNVSTHYSQGIPGVDNVTGVLSYTQEYLKIELNAEQGYLDFNEHFVVPIPYETLQANVAVSINNESWLARVNDISLHSNELTLQADLALEAVENAPMTMSLLANIVEGDAEKAGHYYPLTTMSDNLVNYLNNSLIDGKIKQAQVLINGPAANFPFADNSGIFVVDAELENSTFKFSEAWPAITNFDANLNFTNNSMLITGRSGSLSGLNVSGVQASIDELGHDNILTVDTLISSAPAESVAELMSQSPLKDSVGATLEQLVIHGDISGEFHLNLPLNETENVVAKGLIHFDDNKVSLQTPKMNFTDVYGQLSFENDQISTKNLKLNWRGLPLTLAVVGNNKTDYYDTNIALKADWENDVWQPHISTNLQKYFEGKLQLSGDLSLYQHHGSGFSYQFKVDSNLDSLRVELPEPYSKSAEIALPLKIEVNGQLEQSTFNATYGEELSFFGVLDHDETHFSRAHIILGNEKMLLPMDGFHITTNLAKADASAWQPLISDIINTTSQVREVNRDEKEITSSQPLFSNPERIRGTIGALELLGQNLHNVSFNLLDKDHWWLLQLNAKETRSQIKFYPDWLEQGIDVNADFIHLVSLPDELPNKENESKESENNLVAVQGKLNDESLPVLDENVFANIPKINFSCERCQYNNLNLGKVNFSLSRESDNIINIDSFKAKRERAELTLSGQWRKVDSTSVTSINGGLSLKNIEYELEQLGYGSIIRDSGGKLDFDLNWQGGPHEFDFRSLNGGLSANVDDGYLSEVSDKARIFSVLSLQSIVRKLTLDFRDIFSDGMFYKDIKGDYSIKEGVLYTANTRMNGSAGDLFITGNTSFVNNSIDYHMSYKPNLTSSLPVLAWIATLNPVVFLAGVAIDQVITSQVVSEFNFELTGSMSEPNFKEVNRKSRDVSVGRSKPPEFVDSGDNTKQAPQEKNNSKSFKEFSSPRVTEEDQNPFQYNNQLEN